METKELLEECVLALMCFDITEKYKDKGEKEKKKYEDALEVRAKYTKLINEAISEGHLTTIPAVIVGRTIWGSKWEIEDVTGVGFEIELWNYSNSGCDYVVFDSKNDLCVITTTPGAAKVYKKEEFYSEEFQKDYIAKYPKVLTREVQEANDALWYATRKPYVPVKLDKDKLKQDLFKNLTGEFPCSVQTNQGTTYTFANKTQMGLLGVALKLWKKAECPIPI